MLYKNGKEITAVYIGQKAVASIYRGAALVWQAIRSCFGSGWWSEEKPWTDGDAWKDN